MQNKIAIVIPAFNEAKTLPSVINACLPYSLTTIVIDDGSTDETFNLIKNLPIKIIQHPKRKGKSESLRDGFNYALSLPSIDAIITLDADDQHNPADIPRFIAEFQKNTHALIIGARMENAEHAPKYRLMANKTADYFISKAAGKRIIDSQSGFRLYPRQLLENTLAKIENYDSFTFETEILIDGSHLGFDINYISIKSHYPDDLRPSRFKPFSDSVKIAKLIIRKLRLNRI